ncbi:hypothetical protein [Actinopolymorpha sp. B9G3]|uniref:hypothetical protein n=1 Tax=Actinopolymorpha sp. B9G3 TaxID=3158970 RepID=UPI0032D8C8C4
MKLTQDQVDEFDRWGLLRLPDAIPHDDATSMGDLVWRQLSTEHGIERDRPDTWTVERPLGFKPLAQSETFRRTGAAPIAGAADALMGKGSWEPAKHWRPFVTFAVPGTTWDVPLSGWHYDCPFDRERIDGVPAIHVFAFMAPLRPKGGGTLVLAGSHHLVRKYTAAHPGGGKVHSRTMKDTLGAVHPWLDELWHKKTEADRRRTFLHDGAVVDGIPLRVVELTGEPGEAYLMNSLLLHAPAPNVLPTPRMMLIQMIGRTEASG